MKDFLSHIDLITHAGGELVQCVPDDPTFSDDALVGGGLFGDVTYGHVRRLRKAIDDYHARYGEAETGAVKKLLSRDQDEENP